VNILYLLDGDLPRHRTDKRVFLFALPHFKLFPTTTTEMQSKDELFVPRYLEEVKGQFQ
jgi:hypothetical protein